MSVDTEAPVVQVTQRAAEKAIALAAKEGYPAPHLRIRVVAGGCSGFATRLSFESQPAPDDVLVEAHGLTVLVDPKSVPIMSGSTLEFSDALLGGGFRVENPRAIHRCACGDSFAV